ncbi:unnamed protein product [Pylaiella littoralis]
MANSNTTRERKRDKLLSFGQQTIKVATSTAAAAANTAVASINSSVGKGGKEQSAGQQQQRGDDMAEFAGNKDGSVAGKVNVNGWNLYGRDSEANDLRPLPGGFERQSDAVFLVGPIVGAVTETTGRVLIEVASEQTVTMEAFMDDESVCTVTKEVRPRTPTAFQLEDLAPTKKIRVVVIVDGEVREARFTTLRDDKVHWKIAVVSCNCHTHTETVGLWSKLSKAVSKVDCVLHLGDQIYGDSDFGTKASGEQFESAWHSSLTLLEPLERQEWAAHEEEVREFYRKTYRTTWNMPDVATVLASTANYMICDDHEFTDDLGDEPEHSNPSSLAFYVATLAYQVYNEYQHQLHEDVDVKDPNIEPFYSCKLSNGVGFFMTDNRVERSLHRAQGTVAAWEDRNFMGPSQWERITEAFESDFADCRLVLFGTPTPLVFISQKLTSVAQKKINDARGTWGHKNFKTEQEAMTKLLSDWQSAKSNRAVVTLGGDVHMGGFTDSWHNECDVPLHQMTASAIGNIPEGGMNAIRETAIRSAMHADERLFGFKAKHHEWIYGPNYGMIDATIPRDPNQRPHVTLTLVPEKADPAKVRNLQFGDDGIDIKNKNHSRASKQAYLSAVLMVE